MPLETAHPNDTMTMTPSATMYMAQQYARLNNPEESERCYRRVLERDAGNVEALYRLALLLRRGCRQEEALLLLDTAISLAPENFALHAARALVLNDLRRYLDALDSFADACCLAPGNADIVYNIGLLCAELCCPAQAQIYAHYLLERSPDWPAAHYLLLRAQTSLQYDTAELEARHAFLLKADPLNIPLRFARGLLQLKMGNYASGLEGYEWRWGIEPAKSTRIDCTQPRWAGGPLAGRRLLVMAEQGFGDILQFARYLPLLSERGAHVILRLDANRATLARLLAQLDGVEIVIEPEKLPACDLYCSLSSLPYVFGTTIDTIPAPPYLKTNPHAVNAWKARLTDLPRPWIGLCWAGSPEHNHDMRRSLPLCAGSRYHGEKQARELRIGAATARIASALRLDALHEAAQRDAIPSSFTMEPLLRRTQGSFISLQLGPHAVDVDELPSDLRARTFTALHSQADFHDTACLVQALDEVITVDTSVAHITGALGQPGLLLKPAAPEWRWIERNGLSPWYPSLRMMEQRH